VRVQAFGRRAPQAGDRVHALVARCASTGDALVAHWVDVRPAKAEQVDRKPDNVKAPEKGERGHVPERPEKADGRR
jgi:hypothetical protein